MSCTVFCMTITFKTFACCAKEAIFLIRLQLLAICEMSWESRWIVYKFQISENACDVIAGMYFQNILDFVKLLLARWLGVRQPLEIMLAQDRKQIIYYLSYLMETSHLSLREAPTAKSLIKLVTSEKKIENHYFFQTWIFCHLIWNEGNRCIQCHSGYTYE